MYSIRHIRTESSLNPFLELSETNIQAYSWLIVKMKNPVPLAAIWSKSLWPTWGGLCLPWVEISYLFSFNVYSLIKEQTFSV